MPNHHPNPPCQRWRRWPSSLLAPHTFYLSTSNSVLQFICSKYSVFLGDLNCVNTKQDLESKNVTSSPVLINILSPATPRNVFFFSISQKLYSFYHSATNIRFFGYYLQEKPICWGTEIQHLRRTVFSLYLQKAPRVKKLVILLFHLVLVLSNHLSNKPLINSCWFGPPCSILPTLARL